MRVNIVYRRMWGSLLILLTLLTSLQGAYTPLELTIRVYDDGYVAVDYVISLDPTLVEVNVTLFGLLYQDLVVEDQGGLPLNYSEFRGGIGIESLGSTSAHITYTTPDLTNKTGRLWLLSIETPISATIILPEGAAIMGLSEIPLSLTTVDGSPLLIMPPGRVEIYYALGVVGTREHALALIKEGEAKLEEAKSEGLKVEEAEKLLEDAYREMEEGNYAQAEELASRALEEITGIIEEAHGAMEAMKSAEEAVDKAREEGRTKGLGEAERVLQKASEAYEAGDYVEAESLAFKAREVAEAAERPLTPYLYIAIGGAAAAAAIAFLLRRRRHDEIDVEELLEKRPDLRFEDREVIRFLAESGGEAFASEIRDRFNIPRTSAWRLIKRLEREGLVEVRKVGGHSLVRLRRVE
ncbi:MAG TPA: MarR family transcriptional regulator [Candidatus Bathyarchaeota archaeon]|nr:MarR family transcriptional regulator [Candidatus Bathyarchaeota archaeon]